MGIMMNGVDFHSQNHSQLTHMARSQRHEESSSSDKGSKKTMWHDGIQKLFVRGKKPKKKVNFRSSQNSEEARIEWQNRMCSIRDITHSCMTETRLLLYCLMSNDYFPSQRRLVMGQTRNKSLDRLTTWNSLSMNDFSSFHHDNEVPIHCWTLSVYRRLSDCIEYACFRWAAVKGEECMSFCHGPQCFTCSSECSCRDMMRKSGKIC